MLRVGEGGGRAEILILIKRSNWSFFTFRETGISWNDVLFPNASLAIDCFTCIFFSLWFALLDWIFKLWGVSQIIAITYCWWMNMNTGEEGHVPLCICLRSASEYRGRNASQQKCRRQSLAYLCCVTPLLSYKAINLLYNSRHTLRFFDFPYVVIQATI